MTHHPPTVEQSAATLRERLWALDAERALAQETGLLDNPAYVADLDHDIAFTTAAYVGAAVTEIATLRAELDGPLVG